MANFDAGTGHLDGDLLHGYYAHTLQGSMVGVVNERGDVIVEESIDCDLEKLRQTPMRDRAAKLMLIKGIEKARAMREEQRADEAGPKYRMNFVVSGIDVSMDPNQPMTKRERDRMIEAVGSGDGAIMIPADADADYVIPVSKIDYFVAIEDKPAKERTGW